MSLWPPELSLTVLSHLNATDLCLASCVWQELAKDQVLWHSLCLSTWGYVSIYKKLESVEFSYHKLYLKLDEGTVTFNADPFEGMGYFFRHGLLENTPEEVSKFFICSTNLKRTQMKRYLYRNQGLIDHLVRLQTFRNESLPNALRNFFAILEAPNQQDNYLESLLSKFSKRFCECNPNLDLNADMVYILCYSLIMLSVDLTSPHIKNKMSKREFIRNVRHAVHKVDDDMFGSLYDDIYLKGHIAPHSSSNIDL